MTTPRNNSPGSCSGDGDDRFAGRAARAHQERLAEIRRAIADGSYDTPEKLDAAMDALLGALRDH